MGARHEKEPVMTTRDHAPLGAPCWTDLWTSDVERSRAFYGELLGWDALEPSEEFGGYFMFERNGMPTAGGMGDMGDAKADNAWKVYLNTDDIERTLKDAVAQGATAHFPATAVADLGTQSVLTDPTGATIGTWQPGTFPGFLVLAEHGAPSWFELHTNDFAKSLDFYQSVFRWETTTISDTDEFRYAVMRNPEGEDQLAGIMDNRSFPGLAAVDLVGLLARRRRRHDGRRGQEAGRERGRRRRGHALRHAGRGEGPHGGGVQAAHGACLGTRRALGAAPSGRTSP